MAVRVLIVDDIFIDREELRRVLHQHDYEIVGEASDGEEAVSAYQNLRPDLVLLDLVLPRLSGLEAARAMLAEDPRARIVAVCGLPHPSVQGEALRAGIKGFVHKPVEADMLLLEIEDALS